MSRTIGSSKIAAIFALLLLAIPANADEDETGSEAESDPVSEYARSGFYAGANFAGAWYTQVKDDIRDGLDALGPTGTNNHISIESPLGLGVTAGYRVCPRLAGEVHYQWFAKSKIELDNDKTTVNGMSVETQTITGNLKGYLFTGRVQPFLLAGAGLIHYDTEDKIGIGFKIKGDAFVARFGGGVDLYINEHIAAIVEGGYLLPTGGADGLDSVTWSVGLQYRF